VPRKILFVANNTSTLETNARFTAALFPCLRSTTTTKPVVRSYETIVPARFAASIASRATTRRRFESAQKSLPCETTALLLEKIFSNLFLLALSAPPRVSAVRATQRRPHPKPALREVQSIPDRPSDPIVLHQRRYSRFTPPGTSGLRSIARWDYRPAAVTIAVSIPKHAAIARHVVLSAAFPGPKFARRGNPHVAGIQSQHHLAQLTSPIGSFLALISYFDPIPHHAASFAIAINLRSG